MPGDPFDMEPVDDGFGGGDPHTQGNRTVVNEVGDPDEETYYRERIGAPEDHGDGAHINLNMSIENDVTGASEEVDNLHMPVDEF
ncbi:hypothetical protein PNQ92_12355 [Halobacterium salinarum]|nr:hypothetical protein [Halobacterium salinarum]